MIRKTRKWLCIAVSLLLAMNIFIPQASHAQNINDKVIGTPIFSLHQENQPIGGLDTSKPLQIHISGFGVDLSTAAEGDHIEIPFGTDLFTPIGIAEQPIKIENDAVEIGKAVFTESKATLTFNQKALEYVRIENLSIGVTVEFKDKNQTDPVTIFGTTYQLMNGTGSTNYTVTKTGTVDMHTQTVKWSVGIMAADNSGQPITLGGVIFSDDLANVGEYVDGTFAINDSSVVPSVNGSVIRYTLPSGANDTQATLTFSTKMSDSDYFGQSEVGTDANGPNTYKEKSLENTAQLLDQSGNAIYSAQAKVVYTPKWISKVGLPDKNEISGAVDPYMISWVITVNEKDPITMTDAKIVDTLPDGLEFVGAKIQKMDNGSAWIDVSTLSAAPSDNTFTLGTIDSARRIIIVSKMKSNSGSGIPNKVTFSNTASLTFEEYENGKISSTDIADAGVQILTKRPINANGASDQNNLFWKEDGLHARYQIEITKTTKLTEPVIYDILLYEHNWKDGKRATFEPYFGTLNLDDLPAPIKNKSDILKDIENIGTGMKYVGAEGRIESTSGATLNLKIHPVKASGKEIGQILEITGFTAESSTSQKVNLEVKIVDPRLIYPNDTTKLGDTGAATAKNMIRNSAMLYNGSDLINRSATRNNNATSVLYKEAIPADKTVGQQGNELSSDAFVNTYPQKKDVGANSIYNYRDGSAVFRLSINASKRVMSTTSVWNKNSLDGEIALMNPVIEERIPVGWEAVAFADGKLFHVFEGGNPEGLRAVAGTRITDTDFIEMTQESGKMFFRFKDNSLDEKSYVILVKLKPSLDILRRYNLQENGISDYVKYSGTDVRDTNVAILSGDSYPVIVANYQDVVLKRNLLNKSVFNRGDGILEWTIEYKGIGSGANPASPLTLVDQLPQGVELAVDENGSIQNLKVYELTASLDGSFAVTAEISSADLMSYDPLTRNLTFQIPDSAKNYRFVYQTDIVEVGKISNSVNITSTDPAVNFPSGSDSFNADENYVNATANRLGVLRIFKTEKNSDPAKPLEGVEFTLLSKDGSKVIRIGKTDSNGELVFKAIYPGEYRLLESNTIAGYKQDTVPKVLVFERNGSSTVVKLAGSILPENKLIVENEKNSTGGGTTGGGTTGGGTTPSPVRPSNESTITDNSTPTSGNEPVISTDEPAPTTEIDSGTVPRSMIQSITTPPKTGVGGSTLSVAFAILGAIPLLSTLAKSKKSN